MNLASQGIVLAAFLWAGETYGWAEKSEAKGDPAGSALVRILELAHFSGKTLAQTEMDALSCFADLVDPLRLFVTDDDLRRASVKIAGSGGLMADIAKGDYRAAKSIVGAARVNGGKFTEGSWGSGGREGGKVPLIWESLPRALGKEDLATRWRLFLLRAQLRGEASDEQDILERGRGPSRIGEEEVRDLFLDAVAGAFDPNSEYQRPYHKAAFARAMSLESTTTGIVVERDDSGRALVKEALEGGPAAGSEIVAVEGPDGKQIEARTISDAKIEEMVGGEDGGVVKMQIEKQDGESQTIEVEAEKDPKNNDQRSRAELVHLGALRIGLLSVPSLYGWGREDSGGDMRRLAERLSQKGAHAIVLDLRGNAGGSVDEAREMAGVFIGRKPVALGEDRYGNIKVFLAEGESSFDGPVVCLVDAETGSAAEILAGAIQYYQRGVVVGGGQTRGKGTAQMLLDFGEHGFRGRVPDEHLGALRVSTMILYTPGGRGIQGMGIQPDITVPNGLEAARIVGRMRRTNEIFRGKVELDNIDKTGQPVRRCFEEVTKMSLFRTAKDPFFSSAEEAARQAGEVFEENSLSESSPEKYEFIRALHRSIEAGKNKTREFTAERVAGPGRGTPGRLLLDPYEGEGVRIAGDLVNLTGALPVPSGGVGSPP